MPISSFRFPFTKARVTKIVFDSNSSTPSSLLDNLVAWYDFDESSGNAADSSGNGKTITNNGSATFVSGKINNATDLEQDSSQYFRRTGDNAFSQGGDFTVSVWINPETAGAPDGGGIASYSTSESEGDWMLAHFDSSQIGLYARATGDTWKLGTSGANFATTSTWTHVVARRSSGTVTLWKNGTPTMFGAVGGWETQDFVVGCMYIPDTTWNFDGLIDLLGVWSKALTDSEIGQLHNSGNGLAYPFA
jgi:hypothetical protein